MFLDTQQVELVGRNLLTSSFIADGIEVALPLRDRGIDLIAFNDLSDKKFKAVPVQLKSSTKQSFSVHRKYKKFPNLLMAYVWFAADPPNAKLYIMTYKDAVKIADELGWTKTKSWEIAGYSTQAPSKKLLGLLQSYLYEPGVISKLVRRS